MTYQLNMNERIGNLRVSTVGPLAPQEPPFETMIFRAKKITYLERYGTIGEAVDGHVRIAEDVRALQTLTSRYSKGF